MTTDEKINELTELLEIAYIGRDAARDEDQVRHWEGQIEELEGQLDWMSAVDFWSAPTLH